MSKNIVKIANPQGKGNVAVMNDLQLCAPEHIRAKSNHQWLADYFSSSLVLSAQYRFKPVIGKEYYLYFKKGGWKLSLIEPHAWKLHAQGFYFARCELNSDMTWSLRLSKNWHKNRCLVNHINEIQKSFADAILEEDLLIDKLPFYLENLPYYQRLGANALARSLKLSLEFKLGKDKSMRIKGNEYLEHFISFKLLAFGNTN